MDEEMQEIIAEDVAEAAQEEIRRRVSKVSSEASVPFHELTLAVIVRDVAGSVARILGCTDCQAIGKLTQDHAERRLRDTLNRSKRRSNAETA